MSEFATVEALKSASKRRFAEIEIAGMGKLCIRSLNGSEFSKIKSAIQRSVLASQSGKEATEAEAVAYVMLCVVDPESKEPLFNSAKEVNELDAGLLEYIAQKCADHCDFPMVEQAAKN